MPWAAGVYSLPRSWVTDKGGGVAPSAINFDQQDNDIATANNNCLCIDGQNKMTAALDMNSHALANVTSLNMAGASAILTLVSAGINTGINMGDNSMGVDLKYWRIKALLGTFAITALTDALALGTGGLSMTRTGSVVSNIGLTSSNTLSFAGSVSTANASAAEVGTKGAVARNVTASDNTANTDAARCINLTGGVAQTFTLDGDPPTDSVVRIVNRSGNNWTIAASGTLRAGGATGSITLATNTGAEFYHEGGGNWTRTS